MIRFIHNPKLAHITLPSSTEILLEGAHLTAIPALIDPHVHFRTPGDTHKEDWITASRAAISGGVTTVFDMPNNKPPCNTRARLHEKKALINTLLKESGIPLRYYLYFGADREQLEEIRRGKEEIIGLKIYLGSTTGSLLVDDAESIENIFRIAKKNDILISVHAENEAMLQRVKVMFNYPGVEDHPAVRPRGAAVLETERVIRLAKKYDQPVNILHIGTQEEIELIRKAKAEGIAVHAETTPNHLFLTTEDYKRQGTLMQMNPPVRESRDQKALWEAIADGTIDWIGTDHAPHTLEEKRKPYPLSPSGIPGVETLLPLLLNAVHEKRLSLEKMIELTRTNIERIFKIPHNEDLVFVDLEAPYKVDNAFLRTKCGFSPYHGMELIGRPVYTLLKNRLFDCRNLQEYTC